MPIPTIGFNVVIVAIVAWFTKKHKGKKKPDDIVTATITKDGMTVEKMEKDNDWDFEDEH